jgi:mediator of RNA polymerase II transcription subunit 12
MAWLADFQRTANLAQLGFVAQLIGDYLPDMLHHLAAARVCIKGACEKIKEVSLKKGLR